MGVLPACQQKTARRAAQDNTDGQKSQNCEQTQDQPCKLIGFVIFCVNSRDQRQPHHQSQHQIRAGAVLFRVLSAFGNVNVFGQIVLRAQIIIFGIRRRVLHTVFFRDSWVALR